MPVGNGIEGWEARTWVKISIVPSSESHDLDMGNRMGL